MINLFPYTDAHELNLDWVVEQVKANNTKVKDLTHTVENLHFDFDSKADKATTYTKTEVDTLLLTKADVTEFNNYYNKGETDSLLAGKADLSDLPDMSNYYDKTETDNLLATKANVSDLPDMSNYYDKTTTDGLLANKADKTNTYTKTQVDFIATQLGNRINNVTVQTLTFTETTNALGAFYIGNLTAANSIILEIYSTEYYTYLFRLGNGDRWVAYCLNDNINPVGNTEIHVTVKYFDIS